LHGLEDDRGKNHPEHCVTKQSADARRKDCFPSAYRHRSDDCSGPKDSQESRPTAGQIRTERRVVDRFWLQSFQSRVGAQMPGLPEEPVSREKS
jgi:hypothetical protein